MAKATHKIAQAKGLAAVDINVATQDAQTMMKVCKNGSEWLSPTGWSATEKITLLDSVCTGGTTRFTIPASFAENLSNGDKVEFKCDSLDINDTIIWKSTTIKQSAPTTDHPSPSLDTVKSGLIGKFISKSNTVEAELSDAERAADAARKAAENSAIEMRRAQDAKRIAEEKAAEAAQLAEDAKRMEQEQIEAAAKAELALKQAEKAQAEEAKRIEAERIAEEKRLAEEARLAEIARKKEQERLALERKLEEERRAEEARLAEFARRKAEAKRLDAERLDAIAGLKAKVSDANRDISKLTDESKSLESKMESAKLSIDAQVNVKTRLNDSVQNLASKISENEAALAKRKQQASEAVTALRTAEKLFAAETRAADKAAKDLAKAQAALASAEEAAQEAIKRVNEKSALAEAAKKGLASTQEQLSLAKQTQDANERTKADTEKDYASIQERLAQLNDTHAQATENLKAARQAHSDAENTLRLTGQTIDSNQARIMEAKQVIGDLDQQIAKLETLNVKPGKLSEAEALIKSASAHSVAAAALSAGTVASSKIFMDAEENAESESAFSRFKSMIGERFNRKGDDIAPAASTIGVATVSDPAPRAPATPSLKEELAPSKIEKVKDDALEPEEAKAGLELVADNPDLDKSPIQDEFGMDDEDQISKRKIYGGLSAALLVSVAGLAIASSFGGSDEAVNAVAKTEKIRVERTAVLSASVVNPAAAYRSPAPALAISIPEVQTTAPEIEKPAPVEKPAQASKTIEPNTAPKARETVAAPRAVKPVTPVVEKAKTPAPKPQTAIVSRPEAEPAPVQSASLRIQPRPAPAPAQTRAISYSEVTKDVQEQLQDLGFYNGSLNGLRDPLTIEAMNEFQGLFGLPESDRVTPELLTALRNTSISNEPAQVTTPAVSQPAAFSVIQPEPVAQAPVQSASLTLPAEEPVAAPPAVQDVIVEAERIKAVAPRYPDAVRRSSHTETAVLVVAYDIDASGQVVNARIDSATGVGRHESKFSKAALRAIRKSSFSPKTVNGAKVESIDHTTKYTFNIQ